MGILNDYIVNKLLNRKRKNIKGGISIIRVRLMYRKDYNEGSDCYKEEYILFKWCRWYSILCIVYKIG